MASGPHRVAILGVAPNCQPRPGTALSFTVTPGEAVAVAFHVACVASGFLVSAPTLGVDGDLSYRLVIDGIERPEPVYPNEATTITRVPPGTHTVRLAPLKPNCTLAGNGLRSVKVEAGAIVPLRFDVTCVATTAVLHLRVRTTGDDIDPNGYRVELSNGFRVLPPGTLSETTLIIPAVPWTLTLGDVADNCHAPNPSGGRVTPGGGGLARDTVRAELALECARVYSIAFVRNDRVMLSTADGSRVEALELPGWHPAWSPDGGQLAFSCAAGLCIRGSDGLSWQVVATPGGVNSISWSGDGRQIAFAFFGCKSAGRNCRSGIGILTLDGLTQAEVPIPKGTGEVRSVSWSPTGLLAFGCAPPTGYEHICTIRVDGTGFQSLTTGAGYNVWPQWSPDGNRLMFWGGGPAMVMNADGSAAAVVDVGVSLWYPTWMPDGEHILFSEVACTPGGDWGLDCVSTGLRTARLDGSNRRVITTGDDVLATWRR
jgi:hypothetical protein